MSLYDKFHSGINIDYIYDMLSNIIEKSNGEKIHNNYEYKNIFIENSKKIFKSTNTDDISVLNKILLDDHEKLFTDLKKKENEYVNVNDKYNDLMKDRNIPIDINEKQFKGITDYEDIKGSNIVGTKIDDLINLRLLNDELPSKEGEEVKVKHTSSKKKAGNIHEKKYPEIKVLSTKRDNIQSSRYNYSFNLVKNNISVKDLKKISKMAITIEDNYIFSIPIIFLKICELDISISLKLDKVIENNNRKIGYFIPLEYPEINKKDIEKISIDIRDISETVYGDCDISKVNLIELKENEIIFTCTNIENNYFVGDYIKVINNFTKKIKINTPLKIKQIDKQKIYCDFKTNRNKKINDVDMKLLNTSNQNIIFFN